MKVKCLYVFWKCLFLWFERLLEGNVSLHSIERQRQPSPGIPRFTRETSFWMRAAKTHGLTDSCIIVQCLTLPGMAQRGSYVQSELVDK